MNKFIKIMFLLSSLLLIVLYIVDLWQPLLIVTVLKTIAYLLVGTTISATLFEVLSTSKKNKSKKKKKSK